MEHQTTFSATLSHLPESVQTILSSYSFILRA